VRVSQGGSKKSHTKERLCAVGAFRLYFFSRKGKFRVSHPLLEVERLVARGPPDEAHVHFRGGWVLVLKSRLVDDLVHAMRRSLAEYVFTMVPAVEGAPGRLRDLGELEERPLGSFAETYRAVCNYLQVPFRPDVHWDLSNLFPANGLTALDMREFEHLSPQDFQALVQALALNANHFTALKVKNFRLNAEQVQQLADCVAHNTRLERIVLVANGQPGRDGGLVPLADALSRHVRQLSLRRLNVGSNALDERGLRAFGRLLAAPRGAPDDALPLESLKLKRAACPSRGWAAFFADLRTNARLATSLRKLDLSHNHLGDEASPALAGLVQELRFPALRHLDVSYSGLAPEVLFEALAANCPNLSHLNLAGNRFSSFGRHQHLASFLQTAAHLQSLNLSDMGLTVDVVKLIFKSVTANLVMPPLALNLSRNRLGPLAANLLASLAGELLNIETLDLTECDLTDEGVAYLAEGLQRNRCIRSLKIGRNFAPPRSTSSKQLRQLRRQSVAAILALLDSDCPIVALALEGDARSENQLRGELSPLLLALGSNERLTSLDISGQGIGNSGAALLGKALQVNCALRRLWIDENHISLQGFQALALALSRNETLYYLPTPVLDISRSLQGLSDSEQRKLLRAVSDIERALYLNVDKEGLLAGMPNAAVPLATSTSGPVGGNEASLKVPERISFRRSLNITRDYASLAGVQAELERQDALAAALAPRSARSPGPSPPSRSANAPSSRATQVQLRADAELPRPAPAPVAAAAAAHHSSAAAAAEQWAAALERAQREGRRRRKKQLPTLRPGQRLPHRPDAGVMGIDSPAEGWEVSSPSLEPPSPVRSTSSQGSSSSRSSVATPLPSPAPQPRVPDSRRSDPQY
jgi:Ran GTPase-activating protein (RanGAP) involved in mRNA processing and transport